MSDLQHAIGDIEARAAAEARGRETTRAAGTPASSAPITAPTLADADTAKPATVAGRSEEHAAKKNCLAINIEPRDPLQAAAQQVLMQMDSTPHPTLLLLADSPIQNGRESHRWGHVFAGMIDVPVLAIELELAPPPALNIASKAGREIPQITQSKHPGLCTVATAWHTLKRKQADRWWSEAWESFGMILLDGSGLDLASTESILPRCTHVLFLVEYENTSRSWATQIGKLIATHRTRTVGCIATASPHAA